MKKPENAPQGPAKPAPFEVISGLEIIKKTTT
jgi:hypothetical protein